VGIEQNIYGAKGDGEGSMLMNCTITDDSREYLEFLQKFEVKKTTDDCYTPPKVYDAVKDWVLDEYADSMKGMDVIRPFYPEGDFAAEDYCGKVVIDNPPFSILSKIVRFYEERDIKYFLFAPALTTFNVNAKTSIITASNIEYANGAKVQTNFITSLDDKIKIRSAPKLKMAIEEAQKKDTVSLPRYTYPANVISSARLSKIATVNFSVKRCEAFGRVSAIDSQRIAGKTIFGGGYIISTAAAAELKAAELKAAELKVAHDEVEWKLSEREVTIIAELDKGEMV
jgi:hypothetical protein